MKSRNKLVLLVLVMIIGIFLRLHSLQWETLGYGEMEIYQSVQEFARGNIFKNFYIFNETPLLKYAFTLASFLHPVELSMRAVSAIFGIAAILGTFYFAQRLYDKWTALLSALFVATSLIHLQFSRYVQFEAALSFFYIAAFYFLWKVITERKSKDAIILGILMGLGILVKTMFINAIITIVILAFIYKLIAVKIKPNFSLSIDNKFLMAVIVGIVAFFLAWPAALYPLSTQITVNVEGHINEIGTRLPTLLLVFGYRFTEINKAVADNFFLSLPVIGQFFFFVVKENILLVILFFAGLLTLYKKPNKHDKYVGIILLAFFALLWIQNVRFTYRYITIAIPFISIVAARSTAWLRTERLKYMLFGFLTILLLVYAVIISPNYAIYYNQAQDVFNIPESEGRFNEGMNYTLRVIDNCSSVLAENFYVMTIQNYMPGKAAQNATVPDCIVRGVDIDMQQASADNYISSGKCVLYDTAVKNGKRLIEIYHC